MIGMALMRCLHAVFVRLGLSPWTGDRKYDKELQKIMHQQDYFRRRLGESDDQFRMRIKRGGPRF